MNECRMDGDLFGNSYLLEVPGEQRDHLEEYMTSYQANDNTVVEFCSLLDSILNRILRLTFDISHRFIHFVEELVHRDACRNCECWPITSSDHFTENFHCSICRSLEENSLSPHIGRTNCQTFTRGLFDTTDEPIVATSSQVMRTHNIPKFVPFILQGLITPVFGLQYAWKLAMLSWRYSVSYIRNVQVQVCRIATRVQTTLRGSSDDIGWLQHAAEMPPVEDGTPRFLELLSRTRNGKHTLPNSYVYLLIPGLLSNHGPLYFVSIKKFFSKMGLACHIAKIHSEASVEHNALELKLYIDELYWGSGKRVMLLGHSKGGVDAAAALSMYWNDLKGKVAGLALVQSPYGGTPVASDILREGQIGDKETRRIMELLICKVIKGDMRALEDLTYEKRKEFILKHKLPLEIPIISFHSEANIALGVIATMTHIAHAELPWLPLLNFGAESSESPGKAGTQVPVVIPISAAMTVCALHLQLRYGEKSDGVVTCRDAEVPGSVVVRPDRKLDHAWMVYSSRKENPLDPDGCDMCEALLTLLVELDKKKQEKDK